MKGQDSRGPVHVLFGECEFDAGRRLLLRHGRSTPLSPKAFQLLEVLLDRRPEALPKAELLELLWPETFVSDGSLHNLVAEVRGALGDTPRAPRYIRTVPRYGYAFCGDARAAAPAMATSRGATCGACLVHASREWSLSEGTNLVGRDRDCTIRLESASVSRHHARIELARGQATLEDLESKNGTLLNRRRVRQRAALKDGDEIQVGSVTMTYRILDQLPSTATHRL
jgi:DNA-binding winged helix-turn-helix (wHTH) protein